MPLDHTMRLPAVAKQAGCVWPSEPADVRPAHFGDAANEYSRARTGCVVFDTHDRVQVVATGSDAVDFLNNFCTAPLKSLADGDGAEAFFPNIKGRVVGHAFLFKGESSVYLSADAGVSETLLTHLRKYKLIEDVELTDATGAWGELIVAGPQAAAAIQTVLGRGVAALPMYGHVEETFRNASAIIRRLPLLPVDAFAIAAETDALNELWPAFCSSGVCPAGQQVYEALRIEAGWPQMGLDISDAHLVQEVARTRQAVSFEKGCYLGQEPIARLDAMGHTNRELRTLRIEGGQPLGDGVVSSDDAEVGRVSSSAAVPGLGQTIAMAVLKKKAAAIGAEVTVDGRPAVVEWFQHPGSDAT